MTAGYAIELRRWVLSYLAAAALAGCGRPGSPAVQTAAQPEVRVAHLPPRPKDVLEALMRSSEVSLSVDKSCNSVGTEASDQTIGRYVSGFLAEQSAPKGKNWIDTGIEPEKNASGVAIWRCRVTIRHEDGDDRWGWGVQFDVRQDDGGVIRDSYRCLGAG